MRMQRNNKNQPFSWETMPQPNQPFYWETMSQPRNNTSTMPQPNQPYQPFYWETMSQPRNKTSTMPQPQPQPRNQTSTMPQPQPRNKTSSKLISIPVRFVSSESELTRTVSATKIQKVLRGFLVRNATKKMVAVTVEIEKIEKQVSAPETVEILWKEPKERVRVSETIMNLLLRLDSVRVLHYSGLRDARRSLIKKAIALQERVDQLVLVDPIPVKEEEKEVSDGEGTWLVEEVDEKFLVVDKDGRVEREEVMEVEEEGECVGGESDGTVKENFLVKEEEGGVGGEDCKGGEGDENRELLEKMIEDNDKMMKMMTQLFERNEMQTRLLCSLAHRVEQLERVCHNLERKKKKRNARAKLKKEFDPKNDCI